MEIEGTHYILTAAHVWYEIRDAEQIGLTLTAYLSTFSIPRDAISTKELWNGKISEWGPDLALLELPRPIVSTIEAHKSFLNLAQQRATFAASPPDTVKAFWTVTGMVGEFSEVQTRPEARIIEVNVQARAFFSVIHQTHQRNGYDYLDLRAKSELPGVPSSFVGVSGGGLWQVGLSMKKSGEISWNGKRHFRGVAFWELVDSDGCRVIRCHGPRSLFEKAWESWALPRSD